MKFKSIQVLRAVAVLLVVFFHANQARFPIGPAGVDIFFVISGFIMAQVSQGRGRKEFITARLWRIFPIYFICFALYAATRPLPLDACREMYSLTLMPVWGDCFPYIVQAWSLSYELLFYAMVAIFIRRLNWLFVILPALVVVGQFIDIGFVGSPFLLEFMAGLLIARMPLRYGLPILIAGTGLLLFGPIGHHSPWRVLFWGLPSAMIVYGALALERHFAEPAFGPLIWMGDASYSIYLAHTLISGVPLPAAIWAILATVTGCLVYQFIERPLLTAGREVFGRRAPAIR